MAVQLIDILTEERAISSDGLERALESQREQGGSLADCLVREGVIGEDDLYRLMSRRLDVPALPDGHLSDLTLTPELCRRVPRLLAQKWTLIPLDLDIVRGSLSVAMFDPSDVKVLGWLRMTTRVPEIRAYLARRSAILQALDSVYTQQATAERARDEIHDEDPDEPFEEDTQVAAMADGEDSQFPDEETQRMDFDAFVASAGDVESGPQGEPGAASGSTQTAQQPESMVVLRPFDRPADVDRTVIAELPPDGADAHLQLETMAFDLCDSLGVLVSMLEERIDPGAAVARECARLSRLVARELGLAAATTARVALAAHLYGLDVALRREVGAKPVADVDAVFAPAPESPGGLNPTLRTLGVRALAAGEIPGEPPVAKLVEVVSDYLDLRAEAPDEASDAETLMQLLRAGGAEPMFVEALTRAIENEDLLIATRRATASQRAQTRDD